MSILSGQGPFLNRPPLALETKARHPIHNRERVERLLPAMEAAAAIHQADHPTARMRSLSATYNCIGMVVASRRAWVDTSDLLRVLQEDGLRLLAEGDLPANGDVVVYRRDGAVTHAGLIIACNVLIAGNRVDPFRVLSQWGADGEYEHDSGDVPQALGSPVEYWTDRRVP
jgi:hypothetical protein